MRSSAKFPVTYKSMATRESALTRIDSIIERLRNLPADERRYRWDEREADDWLGGFVRVRDALVQGAPISAVYKRGSYARALDACGIGAGLLFDEILSLGRELSAIFDAEERASAAVADGIVEATHEETDPYRKSASSAVQHTISLLGHLSDDERRNGWNDERAAAWGALLRPVDEALFFGKPITPVYRSSYVRELDACSVREGDIFKAIIRLDLRLRAIKGESTDRRGASTQGTSDASSASGCPGAVADFIRACDDLFFLTNAVAEQFRNGSLGGADEWDLWIKYRCCFDGLCEAVVRLLNQRDQLGQGMPRIAEIDGSIMRVTQAVQDILFSKAGGVVASDFRESAEPLFMAARSGIAAVQRYWKKNDRCIR